MRRAARTRCMLASTISVCLYLVDSQGCRCSDAAYAAGKVVLLPLLLAAAGKLSIGWRTTTYRRARAPAGLTSALGCLQLVVANTSLGASGRAASQPPATLSTQSTTPTTTAWPTAQARGGGRIAWWSPGSRAKKAPTGAHPSRCLACGSSCACVLHAMLHACI